MNIKNFFIGAMLLMPAVNFAQNVGIGTQTPHASAMLDVSSTTRGLLAPRMTTTQRNAMSSPAKGLLVYDTDLNGLYHFNGSAWATVGGGGGGFSLPFEANVNLNMPTFQIQNAGSGDVLFLGAGAGSAINAYNTGNAAAINVNATNGFGVYAQSFNSIPVFALSTNAANTLPAIRATNTGGGVGLHATASNNNGVHGVSSSNAGNRSGVRGDGTGTGGVGVYGESKSSTGVGVWGFNEEGEGVRGRSTSATGVRGISANGYGVHGQTSTGIGFSAVFGENTGTTGTGVRGVANFPIGIGVYGTSTTGTGVSGASTSGAGVRASSETNNALQAQSNSGTALWGSSTSGYALETSGKVKIAGGNTNPAAGAVLTSVDASGNAVWRTAPKVAFKVFGIADGHRDIPDEATRRIQFGEKSFDRSNSFELLANGATPNSNSSTFTAPVTGVYHFDVGALIGADLNPINDLEEGTLKLIRNRNGTEVVLAEVEANRTFVYIGAITAKEGSDHASFHLSVTEPLQFGDKVYVVVYHLSGTKARLFGSNTWFSGHLVFAD